MALVDPRVLTSSIGDLTLHMAKLHEILIRYSHAMVISANDTKGSGCDLIPADLRNGYTFQADTVYFIKAGNYEIDTASGFFLNMENNSAVIAVPGDEVYIYGTDKKPPFNLEGKVLPLPDLTPVSGFGVAGNVFTTTLDLNALNTTYDFANPSKHTYCHFDEKSQYQNTPSPADFRYSVYGRDFDQLISASTFQTKQSLRFNPNYGFGDSTFPFVGFIIPVYRAVIKGVITTIQASGFLECEFDYKSQYNANYDGSQGFFVFGKSSKINFQFSPNPNSSKKAFDTYPFIYWPSYTLIPIGPPDLPQLQSILMINVCLIDCIMNHNWISCVLTENFIMQGTVDIQGIGCGIVANGGCDWTWEDNNSSLICVN